MARKSSQKLNDLVALRSHLSEIRDIQLGALSDDDVLSLLAERKQLEARIRELEAKKAREQQQAALKRSYREAEKTLASINQEIAPGKSDEELLSLVTERKRVEDQLEELSRKLMASEEGSGIDLEPSLVLTQEHPKDREEEPQEEKPTPASSPEQYIPPTTDERTKKRKIVLTQDVASGDETKIDNISVPVADMRPANDFGTEGIAQGILEESGVFAEYLEQIKAHPASIGTVLQEMPPEAKKNKALMLRIAELDPAYVMHYADKETLKRDEDFNVRVASMKNPRNSGNALAEMLPECRTEKVVLAGVRQDFRNIRFASPAMEGYEKMLAAAKQSALEKVRELGQGVSPEILIPKVLQKDEQFMREVGRILTDIQISQPTATSEGSDTPQYAQKSPWSIRHSGL